MKYQERADEYISFCGLPGVIEGQLRDRPSRGPQQKNGGGSYFNPDSVFGEQEEKNVDKKDIQMEVCEDGDEHCGLPVV